jgi:O-acetyl-ADP-ribose deacetylase (regulator of RNase III)
VYRDGTRGEPEKLASAYGNSLRLASEKALRIIAFPAISTGVYRYPKPEAARIALKTTLGWLEEHEYPQDVVFVLFGASDLAVYEEVLDSLAP